MKEYAVIRFTKRNGDMATRLIDRETLKDEGEAIEDFFEPGCSDIKEVGVVQVVGDIDYLDDLYISE